MIRFEAKDFIRDNHSNFVPLWHAANVANAKLNSILIENITVLGLTILQIEKLKKFYEANTGESASSIK